ncbi:uncharacterized protein PSFLO_04510 [Pseudozyma flocculosa]|uniref:Uncharacterized protein n=1 Tax=Pseudozyma flocculosa TaxID=84751 RepID=A0A5C3F6Y6_9BASI|nr:uncharacterized protein PSFLO_04510 [Pseudozyma flocculosa]
MVLAKPLLSLPVFVAAIASRPRKLLYQVPPPSDCWSGVGTPSVEQRERPTFVVTLIAGGGVRGDHRHHGRHRHRQATPALELRGASCGSIPAAGEPEGSWHGTATMACGRKANRAERSVIHAGVGGGDDRQAAAKTGSRGSEQASKAGPGEEEFMRQAGPAARAEAGRAVLERRRMLGQMKRIDGVRGHAAEAVPGWLGAALLLAWQASCIGSLCVGLSLDCLASSSAQVHGSSSQRALHTPRSTGWSLECVGRVAITI